MYRYRELNFPYVIPNFLRYKAMILEPVQTVKILQTNGETKAFKSGEIIFSQGEPAQLMYGIVTGNVNILVDDTVVETLESGDVFGIGALVHRDHRRSSTAMAQTDTQLVSLDHQHFLFAVQQSPIFALEVMKSYSDRLRCLRS
jgi:CRP-like cAMP-binding protein